MKPSLVDIFEHAKKIASETDSWTDERRLLAKANIRAIEATYTDQNYLAKERNYFDRKNKNPKAADKK